MTLSKEEWKQSLLDNCEYRNKSKGGQWGCEDCKRHCPLSPYNLRVPYHENWLGSGIVEMYYPYDPFDTITTRYYEHPLIDGED